MKKVNVFAKCNMVIRYMVLTILIFVCLFSFNNVLVNADYNDDYWLETDTYYISFGTHTRGDNVSYQSIGLYNYGDSDINLIWYVSDPNKILIVDSPSSLYIPAGGSLYFSVKPNTDLSEGTYSASIFFADRNDPAYIAGEAVDVTMTIDRQQSNVSSVTINPGDVSLSKGSNIKFNAVVNGNNNPDQSVNWSISGQSGNSYITSDGVLYVADNESSSVINVRATSKQNNNIYSSVPAYVTTNKYSVSVYAEKGGAVTGGGTVSKGDSITVSASPASGYEFVNWTMNGNEVSTSARYKIDNVQSNMSLVANFNHNTCMVRVSTNHAYGGTTSNNTEVTYGGALTIHATANPGYKFNGWYEGNNKVSDKADFQITNVVEDHSYVADFAPSVYLVSAVNSPSEGGTVTGQGNYDSGSKVSLKAVANDGYDFMGWFLDGTEYSRNSEITIERISRDCSFTAYFSKKEIKNFDMISSVTTSDGIISPEGRFQVPAKASVTYAITPKAGFVISDVKVDNVSVGVVSSYTFVDVNESHTITASFVPDPSKSNNEALSNNDNSNNGNENAGNSNSDSSNNEPQNNLPVEADNKSNTKAGAYDLDNNNTTNNEMTNSETGDISGYSRDVREYDIDSETGFLQKYNLTPNEALYMIKNGRGRNIFEEAISEGIFTVSLYNELGEKASTITRFDSGTVMVSNMEDVVASMLDENELIGILEEKKTDISLNLYDNTEFISQGEKNLIENYISNNLSANIKAGKYFEIVLLKTIEGNTKEISELSVPARITIEVPASLRAENTDGRYIIVRTHSDGYGNMDVTSLSDLDLDPNTITFVTDKFSSYAICYEASNESAINGKMEGKNIWLFLFAGAGSLAVLIIIGRLIQIAIGRKRRGNKKHKRND